MFRIGTMTIQVSEPQASWESPSPFAGCTRSMDTETSLPHIEDQPEKRLRAEESPILRRVLLSIRSLSTHSSRVVEKLWL